MNYLIAPGSVPLARADAPPTSGTPQYATDGNPSSTPPVPPTQFPAYAFNGIMQELMNVILTSGQTPSSTNLGQLLEALRLFNAHSQAVYSGTGTWTCPPNVFFVKARMWAGGAGGGGAGNQSSAASGGGGGEYGEGWIAVVPGTTYAVTIGAAGLGGAGSSFANGTTGGATSFSTLAIVTGGSPGIGANGAVQNNAGTGGSGGAGLTTLLSGYGGGAAFSFGTGVYGAGIGGGNPLGASNTQLSVGSTIENGQPGLFPGGGGGGGVLGGNGGAGAPGFLMLDW